MVTISKSYMSTNDCQSKGLIISAPTYGSATLSIKFIIQILRFNMVFDNFMV